MKRNLKNQIMKHSLKNQCYLLLLFLIFSFNSAAQDPYAGEDIITCSDSVFVNANDLPGGYWSVVQGAVDIYDVNNPNTGIRITEPGIVLLRWNTGDGNQYDEVKIESYSVIAEAGSDIIVSGMEAQLNAKNPYPDNGVWIYDSTYVNISEPNNPNTMISSITPGQKTLIWMVYNNYCNAYDEINITFNGDSITNDSLHHTDNTIYVCSDSVIISASTQFSQPGQWRVLWGEGLILNPNVPQTPVFNLGQGENTFRYSIVDSALNVYDDITINNQQVRAYAGENQIVSKNEITLMANDIANGYGFWTVVSGSGNIFSPDSNITKVTDLHYGQNVFRWNVENQYCGAYDEVIITVLNDSIPDAGEDMVICSDSTMLNALPTPNGRWEVIAGDANIYDYSNPNTIVTSLSHGVNIFRWNVNDSINGKTNYDEVTITNKSVTAYAGQDIDVYENEAVLNAYNQGSAKGTWNLISGAGEIAAINSPETSVSGLMEGANTFRWLVTNNTCSAYDDVTYNLLTTHLISGQVHAGDSLMINGIIRLISTVDGTIIEGEVVDGVFYLDEILSGNYIILIIPYGNNGLTPTYYGDVTEAGSAYALSLTADTYDIDVNLKTATSIKKTVESIKQLKAYPNPFSNMLTIESSVAEGQNSEIIIRNVSGKVIFSETIDFTSSTNRKEINTQDFAPGVYFLTIRTENGETKHLKIAK